MQTETSATSSSMQEEAVQHYPSLLKRYQSLLLDLLFSLVSMFGLVSLLDKIGYSPDWIRIGAFFILWGVYEPLCQTFGCTIGNYITGLRVREAIDETKRINLLQAYIRFIIKFALGWISFLTIHSNPQKRALHDLAASSVVIEVK